jgi:hypothetical protein
VPRKQSPIVIGGALLVQSWDELQRGLQQGYRDFVTVATIWVPDGNWNLSGVTMHCGHDGVCFRGTRFTISGGRMVELRLTENEGG